MANREDRLPIIDLPWPHKGLAANTRAHWSVRHRQTKKHRAWARLAVPESWKRVCPENGDIRLAVMFYPPHKKYDASNLPFMAKAYLDGVADALGVNDKRFGMPQFTMAEAVGKAKASVTIEFLKDG